MQSSAVVLLSSYAWRIRHLFARLLDANPVSARELLGSLCESPSARISEKSVDEVWVTADKCKVRIGDMSPEHVAHCLAMVLRRAREGKYWRMREDGMMSSGDLSEINPKRRRARNETGVKRNYAKYYMPSEYFS